jgi:hypothetical protein
MADAAGARHADSFVLLCFEKRQKKKRRRRRRRRRRRNYRRCSQ